MSWIAITAPLLGLLGAITGMTHTFELIVLFGPGDVKPLAAGISEALVTTEFGLLFAIPAPLTHSFLVRRVNGTLNAWEKIVPMFLEGPSHQGLRPFRLRLVMLYGLG